MDPFIILYSTRKLIRSITFAPTHSRLFKGKLHSLMQQFVLFVLHVFNFAWYLAIGVSRLSRRCLRLIPFACFQIGMRWRPSSWNVRFSLSNNLSRTHPKIYLMSSSSIHPPFLIFVSSFLRVYTLLIPVIPCTLNYTTILHQSLCIFLNISEKISIWGRLYEAQRLHMMKWHHFIFHQFGVPRDHTFWHTCLIFWHTYRISNFKILKIGWFHKTKSKKWLWEKMISIQTLANRDFVWQNVMFRKTKM